MAWYYEACPGNRWKPRPLPRHPTLLPVSRRSLLSPILAPFRAAPSRIAAGPMAILILITLGTLPTATAVADEDLFADHVAPLLAERCVRCHSGSEPEGDLRLDSADAVIMGDGEGWVVVPDDPDASPLVDAVSGPEPAMPKHEEPLSAEQVDMLRAWIAEGAPWPEGVRIEPRAPSWWSTDPIKSHPVPRIAGEDVRNPIDVFIRARLRDQGLSPSPEADRRTLIRRLYVDLHGLLPTPEETEAFVTDPDPMAYERLVDRLLASPRYGERWARHWLDVAHYADTHGYDKDKTRPNAWPYRDYVIDAMNRDLPYADFVRQQLAGDVLADDPAVGIPALGFIAAGPFDWVGQTEVAESTMEGARVRSMDRDDMLATTMNVFVSATAQCARCHNHKFDPITQEDYFRLQAVFAAVDRAPRVYDPDPEVAGKRERLALERASIEADLQRLNEQHQKRRRELLGVDSADAETATGTVNPAAAPQYGYHSEIASDQHTTKWVQVDLGAPTEIAHVLMVGCFDSFNNIGAGFGFPVRFTIQASSDPEFTSDIHTIADHSSVDFPNPGTAGVAFAAQAPGGEQAPSSPRARYVRVTATKLALRQDDYIFALGELAVLTPSGENVALSAAVSSLDSIEAPERWQRANLVDGRYSGQSPSDAWSRLVDEGLRRTRALALATDDPHLQQIAAQNERLADVDRRIAALPEPRIVYAAATEFDRIGEFQSTGGTPRPIHLLRRGEVSDPDLELGPLRPGALSALQHLSHHFDSLPVEHTEAQRRAALAHWIVDPENPLTWRTIVNRVWQYHMGRALVDSPNDFGRMGALPTHPELLDYLAADFRDGGQSLKRLHRQIVTSATYRQSSATDPRSEQIDADNRYLWRANRPRLDAETLRDSVLAVAGRLDHAMGGPAFQAFGFKDDHSPHYNFAAHDVDDPGSARRSIYRFVVRSVPDPLMSALDCADPTISVAKRSETLTPLQALAMLNHPLMVRMSEHFAARVEISADSLENQIDRAFELALQRSATAEERETLVQLAHEHGMANVCRLIFNLNEFLFLD